LENKKQWFGERENFARKRSHAISSKFAIGLLRKQIFLASVDQNKKDKSKHVKSSERETEITYVKMDSARRLKNRGEESEGKRVQSSRA
jgi:hypothetical protein